MNSRAKGSVMARNTVCTTIFTVLALSACAPDEGRSTFAVENMVLDFSTDATSAIRHEVSGYAQKGPFTSDASVRITKLDDALQPTDIHNSTYVSGPLGEFELDVHFEGDALVEVTGEWLDERTGERSDAVTLTALVTLPTTEPIYVNVFSHMASGAARNLASAGASVGPAALGAEGLVHEGLSLTPEWFDIDANVGKVGITGNDVSSAYALWASATILQSADEQNLTLEEWLNVLTVDFEDGALEPRAMDQVQYAADKINLDTLSTVASEWFTTTGIESPNLDHLTDFDADGISDAVDPDGDNDGYNGIEFGGTDCDDRDNLTFPYNMKTAEPDWAEILCGTDADGDGFQDANPADGIDAGTDCDDSNPNVYPGSEEGGCQFE